MKINYLQLESSKIANEELQRSSKIEKFMKSEICE